LFLEIELILQEPDSKDSEPFFPAEKIVSPAILFELYEENPERGSAKAEGGLLISASLL
jgi:hypothetical protein